MTDAPTSILQSIAEPDGWRMSSSTIVDGIHRWRLQKGDKVAVVTVTHREIANNAGEQMLDLMAARLKIALVTAKGTKE